MAQNEHQSNLRNGADSVGSEQSPLIRVHSSPRDSVQDSPSQSSALRPRTMIFICFLLNILMEVGLYFIAIPLNQVLEGIICQNVSPDHLLGANDPRCKATAVQAELSMIRGWQATFDILPGLLTAVPYGLMADKYGPELVLGLSVLGGALTSTFNLLVCSLPSVFSPRMIWLSSAFGLVGGGAPVFNAITFAIIGSVVSEEQRSTVFFYITATVLGSQLVAGPLVYFLININTWLPMFFGLGCLWVASFVALSLPMTFVQRQRRQRNRSGLPNEVQPPAKSTRQQLMGLGRTALWFARGNTTVIILLFTFLVTTLGRLAQDILLQYITKRYEWSWRQAALLLSLQAFLTLMLLTVILPISSRRLARTTTLSAPGRHLWLARISVSMSTFGSFIIGQSETVFPMSIGLGMFALGTGYPPLIRSLLASIVDKRHYNMMYTTISVFETMGSIVAGPLLAASFRTGMEWGGDWLGLPFLVAGCLFGSAAVAVCCVNMSSLESKAINGVEGVESQ